MDLWECLLYWVPKILWHLLPSILTLCIGGVLIQRYFIRRCNSSSFVDAVLKDLEILKSDSLEYWNLGTSNKDKQRRLILAQKIKGAIRHLNADTKYLGGKYFSSRKPPDFVGLLANISDAATGGDFESQAPMGDPSRYLLIVNSVGELRSVLLSAKI